MVVGIIGPLAPVANAAPIVAVDDAGADDEPGQKDLNALSVDYGLPGATAIDVKWNWDDTSTTGATRATGALSSTRTTTASRTALCSTVATDGTWMTQLFTCSADNRTDRCAGPSLAGTFASTASVSIVTNSDPFGVPSSLDFDPNHVTGNTCSTNPACYTNDTVADTNIVLADFVGTGTPTLLNVCSYPSGEPNSDPSDCVFEPNSGFLTIAKTANPSDGTGFPFNASAASTDGTMSWTINGSGSVQFISYAATTTLDLNEVVPVGWTLNSASCAIQTATPTPTGTGTATGVDNLEIRSGLETICSFTDTKQNPPPPPLRDPPHKPQRVRPTPTTRYPGRDHPGLHGCRRVPRRGPSLHHRPRQKSSTVPTPFPPPLCTHRTRTSRLTVPPDPTPRSSSGTPDHNPSGPTHTHHTAPRTRSPGPHGCRSRRPPRPLDSRSPPAPVRVLDVPDPFPPPPLDPHRTTHRLTVPPELTPRSSSDTPTTLRR